MNLEHLIDQFELITDNEEGLVEFRKLILKLAVQGKLTKQNFNAEPVEVLLKRIEDVKKQLYEEREIRKPRSLKLLKTEDIPFEIPFNWKWCKIGDIGKIQGGGTPKTSNEENWADTGISWLTPADLNGNVKYISRGRRDISNKGLENSSTFLLPKGTVLFSSRAPIGYVAIADQDLATNQGFQSCIPYEQEMNSYIYYYLKYVGEILNERASGTTFKEVSGTFVANVEFPLPPLEEQKRVVQKIESLFAQVDELEQKVQHDQELDERLQVVVLDDLQSAETPESSRQSWQRLTDHFEQIYRKPEHIDQLKQAILNEAVRGRLVRQSADPNDEPAEKLLERIKEEKQRLYDEGEIRKPKDLPEITDEEIPYELPEGWCWERLGNIKMEFVGGFAYKSKKFIEDSDNQVIRLGNVKNEGLLLDRNPVFITEEYAKETDRYKLKVGDFLITMTGTNNKRDFCFTAIVESEDLDDRDLYLNQRVGCLRFHDRIFIDVIDEFLKSDFLLDPLFEAASGTANQANLSKTNLMNLLVPIPPKEEQERILQKVDNLFAWCDDLKEKLRRSQQTDQRLLEALVNGVSKNEQVDSDGKTLS